MRLSEEFADFDVETVSHFQKRADAGVRPRGLDSSQRIQIEVCRFGKVFLRHAGIQSVGTDVGGDGTKDAG
jgi:hypothetical protein